MKFKQLKLWFTDLDNMCIAYGADLKNTGDRITGIITLNDLIFFDSAFDNDEDVEERIELKDGEYQKFINIFENLNIENWKNKYEAKDEDFNGSIDYEIKVEFEDGSKKKIHGANIYPNDFNEFVEMLMITNQEFIHIKDYMEIGEIFEYEMEDEDNFILPEEIYDVPILEKVKYFFDKFSQENTLTDKMLNKLQKESYSKLVFECQHKILCKKDEFMKNSKFYFTQPYTFNNETFFLCKKFENEYLFLNWCNKVINHKDKE